MKKILDRWLNCNSIEFQFFFSSLKQINVVKNYHYIQLFFKKRSYWEKKKRKVCCFSTNSTLAYKVNFMSKITKRTSSTLFSIKMIILIQCIFLNELFFSIYPTLQDIKWRKKKFHLFLISSFPSTSMSTITQNKAL